MSYHLSKRTSLPFEEAVDRITELLKEEGFGIITTIDLKATFKKKLNVDFRKYLILGACNPRFAYEGLLEEDKLGVFLPCNLVIQEHENKEVEVSVIDPEETMNVVDNLNIRRFATDVKESLKAVLDRLS